MKSFRDSFTGRTKSPLVERNCRHSQAEQSVDSLGLFLAAQLDLTIAELVEVLLADQALRWRKAAWPSVEEYLKRFTVVTDRPSPVLYMVQATGKRGRT